MIMLATALVVALENPSLHEFGAEVQEPKKIVLKIEDVRYDIGKVNKFETTKWCFYFGRGCGRPTPPPEHPPYCRTQIGSWKSRPPKPSPP